MVRLHRRNPHDRGAPLAGIPALRLAGLFRCSPDARQRCFGCTRIITREQDFVAVDVATFAVLNVPAVVGPRDAAIVGNHRALAIDINDPVFANDRVLIDSVWPLVSTAGLNDAVPCPGDSLIDGFHQIDLCSCPIVIGDKCKQFVTKLNRN
jgi:hypothetical protein